MTHIEVNGFVSENDLYLLKKKYISIIFNCFKIVIYLFLKIPPAYFRTILVIELCESTKGFPNPK